MANRKRTVNMFFRVTPAEKKQIEARRKRTGMNLREYLLYAALGKTIYVIEELRPILSELKAYGRNLNQLTILAHEGRISAVDVRGAIEVLSRTYDAINKLFEESYEVISHGDL